MTAIRKHDVTIAEGTFSVILTKQHRLIAAIHAPVTPLGELHLAFEMDRGIHPALLRRYALAKRGLSPREVEVGGIFGDIGNFVSHAAEGAFNAASKAVTTVTRPVFNVTRDVVSHTMNGIAQVTPFLPEHVRHDISNAARIVARARLGDVTAKQFIQNVVHAAKAGVAAARKVGDTLLDGAKLVSRVVDLPVHVLKHVPGVGDVVTSISPFQKFDRMVSAVQRGDFKALKKMITDDIHTFQGVASLVPVLGTGISAGLSAGMSALEGGSPLEVAVSLAYGAIPIPVGIRNVTDAVVAAVLDLAKSGNLTDAALAAARDRVPSGLPRDVFDTLARIVVKKVPVQKATGALASHYVERYIGKPASQLLSAVEKHVGDAAHLVTSFDPKKLGTLDANALRKALHVGGEWTPAEMAIFGLPGRAVAIGGEEPVAYAVAGDEPIAVGGDDLPVAHSFAIGGEALGAWGDATTSVEVGREHIVGREEIVGGEVSPELIARLPHPSEWLTGRARG